MNLIVSNQDYFSACICNLYTDFMSECNKFTVVDYNVNVK